MSDDQEILNQLGSYTRHVSFFESLLGKYQYALLSSTRKVVLVESLLDRDGHARPVPCPRDRSNLTLVVDGSPLFEYDACRRCAAFMTCVADGQTRSFLLASHARPSEEETSE